MAVSNEHAIACTLEPSLSATQDYFSVFGLQPSCEIDLGVLSVRYLQLQQVVHPDRFLRECDRSQRLAQQQAGQVNTAYNTLKSPLLRAKYLLELAGQQRPPETTLHDKAFLVQQMILRERLDDAASDIAALDALLLDVRQIQQACWQGFVAAWQVSDWSQAGIEVDRMQFAVKLVDEIDERQARLLDD